ncbi:MAG TPA: CRTAC1 family protein [Bacteroidales bacterium]|nr:CRTAC1 family protein [Bacteroidales bacterium]
MKTKQSIYRYVDISSHSAIFFFLILILSGCNSGSSGNNEKTYTAPAANDDYFQEIGLQIGVDFVHSIGTEHLNNIIESSGGGASFIDFDRDGFIDLFLCNGTWIEGFSHSEKPEHLPYSHLYRNKGNGTFEDVSGKAGIDEPVYSMGAAMGDFNNDGYPDIYLCNYGANILYKNNGNGTFSDVTRKAKMAGEKECSIGAVWFDYDNDGFLDIYVGNYLNFDPDYKYYYAPDGFPGPMAYDAQRDYLYHNNGDGTFDDVTEALGINDLDGRAMGVGAVDYDEDGWMDIYVANDHTLNYLWHNDEGKRFSDRGTMSGTAFSQAGEATVSMSVDFADFNGDGLIDIFLSDDTYCSLYQNLGNGVFADRSYPAGIAMAAGQFVGWTSSFVDYDNDGDVDIFKTNGALKHLYGHEDQLFDNLGDGKFKDISSQLGSYFREENVGRGACLGDYDNDGDFDIYVANLNSRGMFLRNNKGNQNNWILIDLEGTVSNRDAIGARIKITSGGRSQSVQQKGTTGYLSQNDHRLHFGLGNNGIVEKIEIKWPSGKVQVIENTKANQILKVTEQ